MTGAKQLTLFGIDIGSFTVTNTVKICLEQYFIINQYDINNDRIIMF